ncbi:hypothetical protein V5O48_013154 [Marasmius crinis-equi]|uniref:CxC2-like cysteine cluster KDZ transposase-associated domain-containing protein n=1 Tax=Marasmius crinis-equi TaxID=585013 RepID=A0ABR3F0V3_9AGAR
MARGNWIKASEMDLRFQQRAQYRPRGGVTSHRTHTTLEGGGLRSTIIPNAPKRPQSPTADSGKKAKRARYNYSPQGESVRLSRFREQPKMELLMRAIIGKEYDVSIGKACCSPEAIRTVRCADCRFSTPTCESCFVKNHHHCPLHWADVWQGRFFLHTEPSCLGLNYMLGHDSDPCPLVNPKLTPPVPFTVVDCNGVHMTKVAYCECPNCKPHLEQLLEARLFPATVDQPETAFTFEVLKDFHLHSLSSKKTAYDYLWALQMKTDNRFLGKVKNPMQDFLRVARLWRTLLTVKRSGGWHDLSAHFPLQKADSVCFPCFACAEPDFNVAREWSEHEADDIDQEFLHLATTFWSIDGHFGLQRKHKIDDPDDVSLLEARGMFPEGGWFKDFVSKYGKASPEKSSCAKFKVMELQNRNKFKGCVISGVVAVQCARHGIFMAATDMSLGETFLHADVALALTMALFMRAALRNTNFFRRLVIIYDIACQYHINFLERIKNYLPDLVDVVDLIVWLIGKLHADGHITPCKYRFSLNYTPGCGRTAGEGIERTWAETKQAGGNTKEMNDGHRHDILIDYWNYWNWIRLVRMSQTPSQDRLFHVVEDRVKAWENLSMEPQVDKRSGEVTSVYRYNDAALPSQESMLRELLESEKSQSSAAEEAANFKGPEAMFINQGLKLETLQYKLRLLVKEGFTSPEDLSKKRESLRSRIRAWRRLQVVHMSGIIDTLASIKFQVPEEEELYLPSFFRDHRYSTQSLGVTEIKLRQGQAFDALSGLKYTLNHHRVLVRTKRKYSCGVTHNTRSTKFIREVGKKRDLWVEKYRRSREALIRLGATDGSDSSDYPAMTDAALTRPNTDGPDTCLGDGSKMVGWLWTRRLASDDETPEQQARAAEQLESVPWFRAKADMYRWLEEKELLEEEFRRLIQACEKMAEVWEDKAETNQCKGEGYVAYGYHTVAQTIVRMFEYPLKIAL